MSKLQTTRPERGVALVIVLAFVVLLTGLVVAFFSRALFERQTSNSSAGQTKIEVFAQGATATIIGDLKQEIAAGSATTATVTPAPANGLSVIYRPNPPISRLPGTAAPAIVGWPVTVNAAKLETDGMNNVVKVSKYGFPVFPGTNPSTGTAYPATNYTTIGPNRAAESPTSTPSANGRSISSARWNKPLLMQAYSTADATPVLPAATGQGMAPVKTPTAFPTPDWILVNRGGANPGTAALPVSFGLAGNNDPTSSNESYVVGRYAYVIYNEGGLLDANAAGYPAIAGPTNTANPMAGTSPGISDQSMYKGSLAQADLTQLQDFNNELAGSNGSHLLTQAQVDQFVGWRNNASAAATGTLGTYSYPNASGTVNSTANTFFSWALLNPANFITPANKSLNATNSNSSDRLFASRQQLIQFLTSGIYGTTQPTVATQTALQSALQCLGTFSRSLNQPALWPDRNRPLVKLKPTTANGTTAVFDPTYPGGNTAYSADGSLTNIYNPVFRSIVAGRAFTRADGSTAVVGEPLVKKRFALSRVAWITYEGPSALAPNQSTLVAEYVKKGMAQTDAQHLLAEGTATNIYNYFGLTWVPGPGVSGANGVGGYWVYNHGITNGGTIIGSLYDVNSTATPARDVFSANREADFFELLKAGINVGAIGKDWGGTGNNGYQCVQDTAIIPQILAIGANIIDEASVTQFPTIIRYVFAPGDIRRVYGKTDLPYINGDSTFTFVVQPPSSTYVVSNADADPYAWRDNSLGGVSASNGIFPLAGTGALMMVPSIWNPYDVNSPQVSAGLGLAPVHLRIVLGDPMPSFNTFPLPSLPTTSPDPYWPPQPNYLLSASGLNPWDYQVEDTFANPPNLWLPPAGYYYAKPPADTYPTVYWNPDLGREKNLADRWTSEDSTALLFNNVDPNNAASRSLYHEPTMLLRTTTTNDAAPDCYMGLQLGTSQYISKVNSAWNGGVPEASGQSFIGELLGTFPLRYTALANRSAPPPNTDPNQNYLYTNNQVVLIPPSQFASWRVEYLIPGGDATQDTNWIPYQEKMVNGSAGDAVSIPANFTTAVPAQTGAVNAPYLLLPNDASGTTAGSLMYGNTALKSAHASSNTVVQENAWDPRTDRWCTPGEMNPRQPRFLNITGSVMAVPPANLFTETLRPTGAIGNATSATPIPGWHPDSNAANGPAPGIMEQNNVYGNSTGFYSYGADTVARRAMGGANQIYPPSTYTYGLPLAIGMNNVNTKADATDNDYNFSNRPIMLHRPYRNVGELAYVFSDTPWCNLDFSIPESGYSGLLDLFCVSEDTRQDALTAGKVDLNTRQPSVLVAMLADAYREVLSPAPTPAPASPPLPAGQSTMPPNGKTADTMKNGANQLAASLIGRTTGTSPQMGPLANVSELVGRYVSGYSTAYTNSQNFAGFTEDILTTSAPIAPTAPVDLIERFREAPIRALASQGQAGTWNLMIDVIAQTGRFPVSADAVTRFSVEGERRYWVHVAIDRQTGQVIDQQIEQVNE